MRDNIIVSIANQLLRLTSKQYQRQLRALYILGKQVYEDEELRELAIDKLRRS